MDLPLRNFRETFSLAEILSPRASLIFAIIEKFDKIHVGLVGTLFRPGFMSADEGS